MVVLNHGKRRAAGLEPAVRVVDEARVWAADGSTTRPSAITSPRAAACIKGRISSS
jgi:hypothetical protein